MNFEWMKDVNLLAYVLGSSLGVSFILGVFIGSKKVEKSAVLYQFEGKYCKVFTYLFNVIMALIFMIAFRFIIQGNWGNYKNWLALSYWLSMVFIVSYVLTRKIIVTKEGIGYMDLFRRRGSLFYDWKKVKKIEYTESSVTVSVNGQAKELSLKLKQTGEQIEEAKKAVKLAMK